MWGHNIGFLPIMTMRLIPLFAAAAAVICAASLSPGTAVSAETKFQKIPSKGVTFKKRAGYWTECCYTGSG